jgi:two-component system, NarL family, response regulator DevR
VTVARACEKVEESDAGPSALGSVPARRVGRRCDPRVPPGQSLLDPAVTQRVLERIRNGLEQPRELAGLTDQERRILEYIAGGRTNREIAGAMFLAEKTVKNYVSSLLAKLGLERRTQAAVLATRLNRKETP